MSLARLCTSFSMVPCCACEYFALLWAATRKATTSLLDFPVGPVLVRYRTVAADFAVGLASFFVVAVAAPCHFDCSRGLHFGPATVHVGYPSSRCDVWFESVRTAEQLCRATKMLKAVSREMRLEGGTIYMVICGGENWRIVPEIDLYYCIS